MSLLCFDEIWFLQATLVQFHFISHREVRTFVSTCLASSILLAISALFFRRERSAGTHGVIVFALVPRSRAPCARQRAYNLGTGNFKDILKEQVIPV